MNRRRTPHRTVENAADVTTHNSMQMRLSMCLIPRAIHPQQAGQRNLTRILIET